MKKIFLIWIFSSLLFSQEEIKYTLHNLSVSGPGNIKSNSRTEICNFCHTPHTAEPKVPLWGHKISSSTYKIYFSETLDSFLNQPSNQSKLCLSCHDGTITLWDKGNEKRKISKKDKGYIGLDLSGSHPISFTIDDSMVFLNNQKDTNLKSTEEMKKEFDGLGKESELKMECSTCHDPHKNIYPSGEVPFGRFESFNKLCLSCHIPSQEKHNNLALVPKGCKGCHKAHGVEQTPLLSKKEPDICFDCHGGLEERAKAIREGLISSLSKPEDIYSSFLLGYKHTLQDGCGGCHKLHLQRNVKEYEICRTCHSNMEIYANPFSTHPVLQRGKENKILNCSSCHNAGEFNPEGVHGSSYKGILFENYEMEDGKEESEKSYKFCYTCHKREEVLSLELHRKHIILERTSCFTCHLSHSSKDLPYLLSFYDEKRVDRIKPTSEGLILYQKLGERKGRCFLTCHNFEHNGLNYGNDASQENLRKTIFRGKSLEIKKSKLKRE